MNNTLDSDPDGVPSRPLRRHYFARRSVYSWERPGLMRKHIYTGAMGHIWFYLATGIGMFFLHYCRSVGMSRSCYGLMRGISFWMIAFQLLSAAVTERTGRRKVIWFWLTIASRVVRIVGILVSFWLWHAGWSPTAVVLVLFISACLSNLCFFTALPPWMSWLADIIPRGEHGAFCGRRDAWMALSVIAVLVPAGFIVDRTPEEHQLSMIVGIFVLATIVGILDVLIHGTIPEPPSSVVKGESLFVRVLKPMRDRRYRPWLVFQACWTFAVTLGGALAMLYFIEELGIRKNFFGGMLVIVGLSFAGSWATGAWSGRLVDRLGMRSVLQGSHLARCLFPAFWLFATPATALWWVGAGSLIGGISTTACLTATNKLTTRFSRPEQRAMYVAASTTVGRLAGGVGVILAGFLLDLFEGRIFKIAGCELGVFQVLVIVSITLRLAATLILLPRVNEPTADEAEDVADVASVEGVEDAEDVERIEDAD